MRYFNMSYYDVIDSPLGSVLIGGSAAGLQRIHFLGGRRDEEDCRALLERETGEAPVRDPEAAAPAAEQLRAYFAGERERFELPLDPGGTTFQRRVWKVLSDVPFGETATYGEVARGIGRPAAARAVGAAIGRNPLWIVVPCHRIVGAGGALTGYGGGLDRKAWLLDHEGVHYSPSGTDDTAGGAAPARG